LITVGINRDMTKLSAKPEAPKPGVCQLHNINAPPMRFADGDVKPLATAATAPR